MMGNRSYDVIVIGGGLLGCFAARNLTRYKLKVALLEMREDLCTGVSRANTAIIYSGCDTKPGTLKTAMCVRAARNFPELCDELGVRYSQCGSIMVSFGERGAKALRKKLEFGAENGVQGMRLLARDEVLELEPNIAANVYTGLYVPGTGTVMPWDLCLAAAENAARNSADILLNTEVIGIEHAKIGAGYEIRTDKGTFMTYGIVNCAGMAADSILEMVSEPSVCIVPTAGDYFILDTKAAGHISHVIFHEPEEKGKGLTLVPTVDGNILIGPTERQLASPLAANAEIRSGSPDGPLRRYAPPLQGVEFTVTPHSSLLTPNFYDTSHEGLDLLRELVSEVMPSLPMEHIIRSFGAVRPNPYMISSSESISDFCIIEPAGEAIVNFVGVKTPGLTCANELGMYAADRMAAHLGAATDPAFDPRRPPPVRLSDMTYDEREAFTKKGGHGFGRIVCRCRGVTEGEIINAISRHPGAVTIGGVKRRTGAGSGRCQGGFCSQRVIELLARELCCKPEEIMLRY